MEVVDNQIFLSGHVEQGDYFQFTTLLNQNSQIDTVIILDSSGGDAGAAHGIAATIRTRGLITAVSGHCPSACARIFMGGVGRHFASETTVKKAYVAFHGNYDTQDGRLSIPGAKDLQKFIMEYSDGKADAELVERWTRIPNRHGMIYFFDPNRTKRKDGVSIFLCSGTETGTHFFNDCEKIQGRTGYDLGIFTSPEYIVPKKQVARQ